MEPDEFRGEFPFTAMPHRVEVDVDGEPVVDADEEAAAAVAQQ